MNVAIRNANDAISLSQSAEGALGKVGDMLQRMRELAVQSANATNGDSDRTNLDTEYQDLSAEITRTIEATKFNGKAILKDDAGDQQFQVGANSTDTITITTSDMSSTFTAGDLTSQANATTEIDNLDTAIDAFNTERAKYGSAQNRFDAVVSTLQVGAEAQSAARSRIMDADFAAETANLSRAQVAGAPGTVSKCGGVLPHFAGMTGLKSADNGLIGMQILCTDVRMTKGRQPTGETRSTPGLGRQHPRR
jgi:flagellin